MGQRIAVFGFGVLLGTLVALIGPEPDLRVPVGARAAQVESYHELGIFGDVLDIVRTRYVERPDEAALIENAIDGMLASLDPHSSYLDPRSYRDMEEQTRGEFGGLGLEVSMEKGRVTVVSALDDAPAARAGLLAEDVITHVNDAPLRGLSLNQVVAKLRGPVATPIKLTIRRQDRQDPIEITLVRDIVHIHPVQARAEGDVAYIRITQFSEQTDADLRSALKKIAREVGADALKGYVLDLRNNPGGLLDQAVAVADAFLPHGEIVSTRGRDPEDVERYDATHKLHDLVDGKPVVILINGGSASASEIVAGALQDHKRVTIMGTRSFGKGSVQTVIPLQSRGALRLTTARYYTPSGRSIQAQGVEPDQEVLQPVPDELGGKDETEGEAGLRGHLKNKSDPTERGASSAYVPTDRAADRQLIAAVEYLRTAGHPSEPGQTAGP
jgi:carboxyl-terminal processing protease